MSLGEPTRKQILLYDPQLKKLDKLKKEFGVTSEGEIIRMLIDGYGLDANSTPAPDLQLLRSINGKLDKLLSRK